MMTVSTSCKFVAVPLAQAQAQARRRRSALCLRKSLADLCQPAPRSNPTLSYTQRLEKRIIDLEEQLALASRSNGSTAASPHSSSSTVSTFHDGRSPPKSNPDEVSFSRSFSSLKVDDKGRITYHNNTLPEHNGHGEPEDPYTSAELDQSIRNRLVANAMQQRALENFSGTPVCTSHPPEYTTLSHCIVANHVILGTLSISAQCPLVLDSTAVHVYI